MFATFALFSWPAVIAVLFSKYRLPVAIMGALFGGYLILPTHTGIDLPLLPELNKHTVPALVTLLFAALALRDHRNGQWMTSWLPRNPLARLFLFGMVAGAFMTVITNSDTFSFPKKTLHGLRIYDGFSVVLSNVMLLLPFAIAYRFFARPEQHRIILITFAIAGLCYSFLALYEIRMSPQLNRMVYGFFPHSWVQHLRGGSFRPLVFLEHGLWLAIFFAMAIIGAIGAARTNPTRRKFFLCVAAWLFLTLTLSSSLGALMIVVLLAPVALLLGKQKQLWVAAVIGTIALSYPALRGSGTITGDSVVSWAQGVNEARAASLQYRLDNENILLAKARERPAFGWGGWGRSRVYDEEGADISTTDGYWVIIIGVGGWARYLSEFGLITVPLILLAIRQRRHDFGPETASIAIILAANLVDLLPNASMTPLTLVVAGALWGRLELGHLTDTDENKISTDAESLSESDKDHVSENQPETSRYTRQVHRIHRTR